LAYENDPREAAGVHEGQLLAGKYRVEKVLGVGGMGVVVAAHHVQLEEKVAIKLLLPEMLKNADVVARFAREARAAVKIKSEHVARVFDVGQLDGGAPYMVMEFLEGSDLAAWLRERGPLPVEQATEFVIQACVAIAEAHGLGIVHRDLKPANLYCIRRSDGQLSIKVLDFGISKLTEMARASDLPGGSVTRTSAVMGSPLYMSPEQVQNSKDVDARTDIWSLGVILFELMTGTVPFPGETFGEIAVKIAVHPQLLLRTCRPEAPPALEAAVSRALEKDRQRRYPNVAEFAVALLPFSSRRAEGYVERISGTIHSAGLSASAVALPPGPKSLGTHVSQRTIGGVTRTFPGEHRRAVPASRRASTYGVAFAGLLVAGGLGAVALRKSAAPLSPRPPAASVAPAAVNPPPPADFPPPPEPSSAALSSAAVTPESTVIPSSKGYSHAPSPSEHRVSPSPDKPKPPASTPAARTPAAVPSNPLDLPPLR
jgi:eukaryotic-like serine/threonine-protein kinase